MTLEWKDLDDLIERAVPLGFQLAHAEEGVETLRVRLGDPAMRTITLHVLQLTDTSITERLVPELLPLALSDHTALAVRHVLGRLPHEQAVELIEPELECALGAAADGLDCRRYSELLIHLGAKQLIPRLIARAREINDADAQDLIARLEGS